MQQTAFENEQQQYTNYHQSSKIVSKQWGMLEIIKISRANNTNSVAEEEKDVLP